MDPHSLSPQFCDGCGTPHQDVLSDRTLVPVLGRLVVRALRGGMALDGGTDAIFASLVGAPFLGRGRLDDSLARAATAILFRLVSATTTR